MDIDTLREMQRHFEVRRKELHREYSELEGLRREFLRNFPAENLGSLPLERFTVGKTDSFCYWLETKLHKLGNIGGSATADKKFGIYFGKTNHSSAKKYRFVKRKYGKTQEEVYDNIRLALKNLILCGKKNDIDGIKRNIIPPMFKGKILSTYFPDKYLSVFSKDHINHFLEIFGSSASADKTLDVTEKREELLRIKNSDEVMKDWSIFDFTRFLYDEIKPPMPKNVGDKLSPALKSSWEGNLPPLEQVQIPYKSLEMEVKEYVEKPKPPPDGSSNNNPDWEKKGKQNKEFGSRGEMIVLQFEIDYLKKNSKFDLAKQIVRISEKDDSAGYDIKSFELDKKPKYIEVKSTSQEPGITNFLISQNELDKAKSLDNYHIYVVFKVNTTEPKLWIIKDPFKEIRGVNIKNPFEEVKGMNITPISYRIKINSSLRK